LAFYPANRDLKRIRAADGKKRSYNLGVRGEGWFNMINAFLNGITWARCFQFFFFPWGLLAWLIFRPPIDPTKRDRRFRLEDYRVQ
jgi:hypothetical protein